MVADTGKWIPGRKVLISPVSLGEPHWTSRRFDVLLLPGVVLPAQLEERLPQPGAAVVDARFFESKEQYFNPYIADAPSTVFTVRANGSTR